MNTQEKISIVKLAVDLFGPGKVGPKEAGLTEGAAPPPILVGISTGSSAGNVSAANSVNFSGFASSSSAGGTSSKTVLVMAAVTGVAALLLLLGKRK